MFVGNTKIKEKKEMNRYNIETYNFIEDEDFQKFFDFAKKGKSLNRASYITLLNNCKRKWIQILNSPALRHSYRQCHFID